MAVTVDAGDALFIAPGTVHETRNPDGADGATAGAARALRACGVSVTFQLAEPMAARYFRSFWQRTRLTADLNEVWPYLASWSHFFRDPRRQEKAA